MENSLDNRSELQLNNSENVDPYNFSDEYSSIQHSTPNRKLKCSDCKKYRAYVHDLLKSKSDLADDYQNAQKEISKLKTQNTELSFQMKELSTRNTRRPAVTVTKQCQNHVRAVYKGLIKTAEFHGYITDSGLESLFSGYHNKGVTSKIADEVLSSSENFSRQEAMECCRIYHKSLKDHATRARKGRTEHHKQQSLRSKVLGKKRDRRTRALDNVNWSPNSKANMSTYLNPQYVSSEEEITNPPSPYKACGHVRKVRMLNWRSDALNEKNMQLEKHFWSECASSKEKASRVPVIREAGTVSTRKIPNDISPWAKMNISSESEFYDPDPDTDTDKSDF